MAQNRKPPAYLEYAATMLANRQYRLMPLAERGLLYAIRLECWENKLVPAPHDQLAKYLGCDVVEVKSALTERVKAFLNEKDGSLTCPELEDYRQHLAERKLKQSNGGKGGAAITNAKKRAIKDDNLHIPNRSTNPQVTCQVTDESLVNSSTVKSSQKQSLETSYIDDPFVVEMIEHEKASYG